MTKKSKKVQGHKAPTGQMSDERMKPKAEHQDRGIGSSFAMAVQNVLEESRQLKGSQNNFLGVQSETLDIKDQSHSLGKK